MIKVSPVKCVAFPLKMCARISFINLSTIICKCFYFCFKIPGFGYSDFLHLCVYVDKDLL